MIAAQLLDARAGRGVPLPASVTASSHVPDHGPGLAADAETADFWQAAGTDAAWLQLDLGQAYHLTAVRQVFAEGDVWSFSVAASLDGATWVELCDHSRGRAGVVFACAARGRYRYVRLSVCGAELGRPASSRGFVAWGTEHGPDLARTASVTASSEAVDFPARAAIDGRSATCWRPARSDGPHWLQVDLGRVTAVTAVRQNFETVGVHSFAVDASRDAASWTTLGEWTNARGHTFGLSLPSAVFRYLRVRLDGDSAHSTGLQVFGTSQQTAAPPVTTRWFERAGSVFRYFPNNHPPTTLAAITEQLPSRRRQGYTAIEVAPPFQGSGRHDAVDYFAGLGATDNYAIDARIGTMSDWVSLIEAAHELGMRVIMFGNLGYADVTAPFFEKAVSDFAEGVDSEQRGWFRLSRESGGERWHQHAGTGVWYYGYWGVHDPSYDWAGTWPDEAARIMRHWLDTGVDGIGMDAPVSYVGFSRELDAAVITGPINERGLLSMPEGVNVSSQPEEMVEQRDFVSWVRDHGYSTIQDLWLESWTDQRFSRIVQAAHHQDASSLGAAMTLSRDALVARGATTVTSASWPLDYDAQTRRPVTEPQPVAVRLLEAATITTLGTLNYLVNAADWLHPDLSPELLPSWTPEQTDLLERIYRAQGAYPALQQSGARITLPTSSSAALAYLRLDVTGEVAALVVLSFADHRTTVIVDLTGTVVADHQVPIDLLTGHAAPEIHGDEYAVPLPGYGFTELAVS